MAIIVFIIQMLSSTFGMNGCHIIRVLRKMKLVYFLLHSHYNRIAVAAQL